MDRAKRTRLRAYVLCALGGVLCGILLEEVLRSHTFRAARNHAEEKLEHLLSGESDPGVRLSQAYYKTPREYLETDVDALISIHRPEDALRLREKLIALLWGSSGLPASLPAEVVRDVRDEAYDEAFSPARLDLLKVVMDFGIESHVYHFIPRRPNGQVVLFHEGHSGDLFHSRENIRKLLDHGYSVVGFCMPLQSPNNQPKIHVPRLGMLKLTRHEHLAFVPLSTGHPVKFFVEPVVTVLNYLERTYGDSSVSMVGFSGGGWTTTLAAAVDSRIRKSFPVAGSYPMYLKSDTLEGWGDYEATVPELYLTANHLELYVLGAYGPRRKQLQVINQFDPCCFWGTKWDTYKDIVRARVNELGAGEFDVLADDSHRDHILSEAAMRVILDELGREDGAMK